MSLSASAENLGGDKQQSYDGSSNMCLELAIEGERLCKAGDCRAGVAFFQAAIQARTDDLRTLSAIYSQLGNAYFYLGDYAKAMQYHRHDLTLARTLGDKLGEAKSSGNLGNTLKVMGRFDEAAAFCQRHLELARELGDELSEGRALYNLGNVWHAKGKSVGKRTTSDSGSTSAASTTEDEQQVGVRECLQRAAGYYEENLALMRRLGDVAAQGRACGNLGNTHYLLGDFAEAIKHHEERLSIAKQFGDKAAERRAHSNLGNSHIFLGHLDTAAQHYRLTLGLAQELGDRAVEAQACYSLGNTHTLLREHQIALDYHLRHLAIAQQLGDKVGEARACWSLGNAHASMCQHDRALEYAREHLRLSRALGDAMGEATARMNVQDLRKVLNMTEGDEMMDDEKVMEYGTTTNRADNASIGRHGFVPRVRRDSMEQLHLFKLTPDGKAQATPRISSSHSVAKLQLTTSLQTQESEQESDPQQEDSFFDLVSRFQAERMDDQRCTLSATAVAAAAAAAVNNKENKSLNANSAAAAAAAATNKDDLLDMIAGMQSNRMDEQRAALPNLPGLVQRFVRSSNNNNNNNNAEEQNNNNNMAPDDMFLEQVARCQGSRLEDQRSPLPSTSGDSDSGGATSAQSTTVPDDDFFSLIMRFQGSGRMEDQRASIVVAPNTVLPPPPPQRLAGNGSIPPLSGLSRYLNHLNGDKNKKK